MEVREMIKWALIALGVVIVVGYSYFVLSGYLRGPQIILSSPLNGFATTTPLITITGIAVHANTLSINGYKTPIDLEGNFSGQLILAPGYNIMTIAAQDRYNRTVEKRVEINLLPKIATSTAN